MSRRLTRTLLAGTAGVVAVALLPVLSTSSVAVAGQVSPVPTTRVFHVAGHAWGHGHGLSQDGAYGAAAVDHRTAAQIVSFYYPHTSAGSNGNPTLRILLSGMPSNLVDVVKPTGSTARLVIHDLASGYQASLPTSSPKWRFTVGASSLTISWNDSGVWKPYMPGGHASFAGPMNLWVQNPSAAPMRVLHTDGSERDYHGFLQVVRAAANNADVLSYEPMEDYLRGVVPRESPSSWPAATLQAQAIAARSFAEYSREHAGSRDYDVCDTTTCQVFGGATQVSGGTTTNLEAASTNAAVQATAGNIRTYGGKVILAQFSASNGGWTTDGGTPYLIAQPDPYDGLVDLGNHSWTASLPASALESKYPSIGTLLRVRVTQRDGNGQWGGRVLQAALDGTHGSVTVAGSDISQAYSWPSHSNGLKGPWWEIVPPAPADFTGNHQTDQSVWRKSNGTWYVHGGSIVAFGQSGDLPVPADYNGDGTADIAVWRPSNGTWFVRGGATLAFGKYADVPVPGDYDGDGKTGFAVWRPSNGVWYVNGSSSRPAFGKRGDIPVPGDYNGDGKTEVAVWRPSNGVWYINGTTTRVTFGKSGDIPVPGDYTGDGRTDLAVWRPSTGEWFVSGGSRLVYGLSKDVPAPGDYNGDGVTEFATFRPSTNTWYVRGAPHLVYGATGDQPLPLPSAIYRVR